MTKKDYYKILGIDEKASKADIKKAYKKLAKKYHPDVSEDPEAAEKFKEINEAAAVLGDDQKREQYDRFGTVGGGAGTGFEGFDFSNFGNQFGGDFDNIFDHLGDIFGEGIFGGRRRKRGRRVRRGSDPRFDLEITLEEAAIR